MDNYLQANRILWDELTKIHTEAESYNVKGFKAGKLTLRPVELTEVGQVKGNSMIRLVL